MNLGNPFEGFKLNTEGLKYSDEHKVRIALESDYKWGSGWRADQEKRFRSITDKAFENAGYTIVESKMSGSCPRLKRGLSCDLYMHPMEFTGYATRKDIDKIIDILKSPECSKVVYRADITIDREVFALSDSEYKKLILDQAKEIAAIIKDYKEKAGNLCEIGFDFARECRIERRGDKPCLCSGQVDIETVENIADIAEALGYFEDKELTEEEDEGKEL